MNITVKVLTKHFKGNHYQHTRRNCPLHEALADVFPDAKICVGGLMAYIDTKGYNIPDRWGESHVEALINEANNGVEVEDEVTLILCEDDVRSDTIADHNDYQSQAE